jgi:hypothetical protein
MIDALHCHDDLHIILLDTACAGDFFSFRITFTSFLSFISPFLNMFQALGLFLILAGQGIFGPHRVDAVSLVPSDAVWVKVSPWHATTTDNWR